MIGRQSLRSASRGDLNHSSFPTPNIRFPSVCYLGPSACFFHLRRLKSIRRILGADVTSGLVSAFVTTRMDYCNSILAALLVHIGRAPAYLSGMVTATADLSSRGRLRSSNTFRYELPLLKRKFGERSFSYAGPKAWNDLPFALQELTDTCTFKRHLKTHLFTLAYTSCRT